MNITLKLIKDIEGCTHFQVLQDLVWGAPPDEIVPNHVTVTVIKNGGGLLGAYSEDGPPETGGMVGAAFWWLGVTGTSGSNQDTSTDTELKVCSHMAGVLPAWQGKGVGRLLKLGQRNSVLEQGLTDQITWTYDPLYLPNGILNIHRLGATCNTYIRNLYGAMQDALNAGVPSDRCQVDWDLLSPRVEAVAASQLFPIEWNESTMQILPTASVLTNPSFRQPIDANLRLKGLPLAVPIPTDIAAIRRADGDLSMAWRLYIRKVFEEAFAGGYSIVDCVRLSMGEWHYILDISQPQVG